MEWRVVSPDWCIFGERIASLLGVERVAIAKEHGGSIFIEMFPGMITEALKYPDSPKICWWTGTDARLYSENPKTYRFGNAMHVTDTPWLIYILSLKVNPVCFLPLPCSVDSPPLPYPKDPAILMYLNEHRARDIKRSKKVISFIKDWPVYVMSGPAVCKPVIGPDFPQDNVILVSAIDEDERVEVFKKISMFIRLMHYDGMSQLIVEMKSLGRHVITTVYAPHCDIVDPTQSPAEIANLAKQIVTAGPPLEAGTNWYRSIFNKTTFLRVLRGVCHVKGWEEPKAVSINLGSELQ